MIEDKNDLLKNLANDDNNMRKYLIWGGGFFILFVIGIVIAKVVFSNPKPNNVAVILPTETTTQNTQEVETVENEIPIENDIQKPTETTTPPPPPPPSNQVQETSKPQTAIQPPKPALTQQEVVQPKHETNKVSSSGDYYIQVASLTKLSPSAKFLKKIEANGFKYKIIEANVNGKIVKRVLIGGYSYKEAKKILPIVKEKISKSAFIKRLK